MFGYKLVKKDYLEKLEHDKDHYFHKCQEAEDKNFELEEDVYELNKYIRELHNEIFEKHSLSNIANNTYDLKVDILENIGRNFKTLRIDLIPIHNSLEFYMDLDLSSVINEKMLEHLSERISDEFFNNIKKELLRNFGYEY